LRGKAYKHVFIPALLFLLNVFSGCGTILSQIDGHKKIAEEKAYRLALEEYEDSTKRSDTASAERLKKELDNYRAATRDKYHTGCRMAVPNVYSGTASDLTMLLAPWLCYNKGGRDMATIALYPLYAPVFLVDTVLSAAADTVILPYTACRQARYGNIEESGFEDKTENQEVI
jgi:uncharacterized protein YceK